MGHTTVKARAEHLDEVQGSRFLAVATPVASVEEAAALLDEQRAAHPDASHHVWAYRVGTAQRFSDDGEPGGTAGRPVLEVILKRELDFVAVVVVRYFGGRKLGAGGLARAYGAAAARALDAAGEQVVVDLTRLRITASFADADVVLRTLDAVAGLDRGEAGYDAAGLVLEVTLPETDATALADRLREVTRGAVRIEPHRP
ncbi:MAG: YigZ family protein [Trueperaceae bacterium]